MFVTRPAFLFPPDENRKGNNPMAVVCAFAASFAQACVFIAMRKLHELHYRVIINYFLLFGIAFSVSTLAVLNVVRSPLRYPSVGNGREVHFGSVSIAVLASTLF